MGQRYKGVSVCVSNDLNNGYICTHSYTHDPVCNFSPGFELVHIFSPDPYVVLHHHMCI